MGLYYRDYMKSAEWQRNNKYLPAKVEEYHVQNSLDKGSKKDFRGILGIILFLL